MFVASGQGLIEVKTRGTRPPRRKGGRRSLEKIQGSRFKVQLNTEIEPWYRGAYLR